RRDERGGVAPQPGLHARELGAARSLRRRDPGQRPHDRPNRRGPHQRRRPDPLGAGAGYCAGLCVVASAGTASTATCTPCGIKKGLAMATKTRQVVLLVAMVCGALGLLAFLLIVQRPPSQHLALRETLVGHTNGVFCLAYSPDGKTLASGGYDQRVRI